MITTDAAAAHSLDKMATVATDIAQDRHAHGHRHQKRPHERQRQTRADTKRQRERDKRRKGRAGPKKIPPKKRGSLGFRV
jgi:hypothetical protein